MEHSFIQFDGKKIHYQDEGQEHSNVIVFLHGFLNSLDVWASYTYTYMKASRVVAIDLPGHGLSDTYGEVHSMEFMARAVKAVLDKCGRTHCVMVGHSMGGYVALAFADAFPYMLKGLVLLHSQALMDSDAVKENRIKACKAVNDNRSAFVVGFIPELFAKDRRDFFNREIKDLEEDSLRTTEEGIVAAQNGMLARPSRVYLLSELECPILFIFGKHDSRIPVELGLSQAMLPKYSETIILGNASHMGHIEERKYLKMKIYNFLQSCYLL